MSNVVRFPVSLVAHRKEYTSLDYLIDVADGLSDREIDIKNLRGMTIATLRHIWDEIGDSSFYEGHLGFFDCADVHRVMNEKGDGHYCDV